MKKLIFILTMVLITGIVAAQTEIRKKDYKIYKPAPTLLLYSPTGATGAIVDFNGDVTLTQTANTLSLRGGDLSLVNNNLLGSGSIGATGGRFLKGWFTNIESTNAPTIGGVSMAKIMTISKTIGGVGVANCDFNFATAANQNEQIINLGAIVPAKSRIVNVWTFTDAVFTGATSLVAETGTSSSGNELIASATIYAANAITATAAGTAFIAAPLASATTIYVSATPGANWASVTAGKVTVYIDYIAY